MLHQDKTATAAKSDDLICTRVHARSFDSRKKKLPQWPTGKVEPVCFSERGRHYTEEMAKFVRGRNDRWHD